VPQSTRLVLSLAHTCPRPLGLSLTPFMCRLFAHSPPPHTQAYVWGAAAPLAHRPQHEPHVHQQAVRPGMPLLHQAGEAQEGKMPCTHPSLHTNRPYPFPLPAGGGHVDLGSCLGDGRRPTSADSLDAGPGGHACSTGAPTLSPKFTHSHKTLHTKHKTNRSPLTPSDPHRPPRELFWRLHALGSAI